MNLYQKLSKIPNYLCVNDMCKVLRAIDALAFYIFELLLYFLVRERKTIIYVNFR